MNNLEIKKLNENDLEDVYQVAKILYNWWGKDCNLTIDDIIAIVKDRCGVTIPITFIAKTNSEVIGTITFLENDAELRKDLSPFIGGVYVKSEYRNKGIASELIKTILNEISKNFEHIYLTTPLIGFYEKFGFNFIEITETNMKNGTPTRERLYKKVLR